MERAKSSISELRNTGPALPPPGGRPDFYLTLYFFFSLITACAPASLAIGTRNGEQET
jgi:hypothetical protein